MIRYINKKNPNYKRGTSYPEQFIYRCLVQVFDAMSRVKDSETGMEFDIEVKEINLRIEYSGEYWHLNKGEKDEAKKILCNQRGIDYIEIIEMASRQETIVKDQENYVQIVIGIESTFQKKNNKLISIVDFILKRYGYSLEDIDIERAVYEALACTKQFKYDILRDENNLIIGTVNREFQYDMSKGNKTGAILVNTVPDKNKDYSESNKEEYKEFTLEEVKNVEIPTNNMSKSKSLRINMKKPFYLDEHGKASNTSTVHEYRTMSATEFAKHCKRVVANNIG